MGRTAPLTDPWVRFWSSPGLLPGVVVLSVLCLVLMHPFSVGGGSELDLAVFMTRAERLQKIAAWNESGTMNTVVFYALDCLWSALWNSLFFALFHRVLKHSPSLLSLRPRLSALLVATWVVDLLENAGIVSLAVCFPTFSMTYDGVVHALTVVKWVGIAGFWITLTIGFIQRRCREVSTC